MTRGAWKAASEMKMPKHSRQLADRSPSRQIARSSTGEAHAFTLVELLVAISILLVMLALVNQIFSNMSKMVGQGMGLSHVLADTRAMQEQMRRDAELMLGPHRQLTVPPKQWTPPRQGGILIIVNREIRATTPDGEDRGVPVPVPDGKGVIHRRIGVDKDSDGREDPYFVRSDQLIFIRARGDEDPIGPSTSGNFSGEHLTNEDCEFIKVWYGHVRRTSPIGDGDPTLLWNDPDQPDDPRRPGALGQPPVTVTQGPQTYTIDNELASDWILGRQALFLKYNATGSVHANGAWVNAPVAGYGATSQPTFPEFLYMGLTDLAWYGLFRQATNYSVTPPQPVHGCLVGGVQAVAVTPTDAAFRLWSDFTGVAGYANEYMAYRFVASYYYAYTYKRLRVNPTPDYYIDPSNPSNNRQYEAWQIAQMHPYFMTGVSDFIVEFAADIIDDPPVGVWPDGEPDRVVDPAGAAGAPLTNTSYPGSNRAFDPNPSDGVLAPDYIYSGGDIRWYSAYETNDPTDSTPDAWTNSPEDPIRYFANESIHYNPAQLRGLTHPVILPMGAAYPPMLTGPIPQQPHADAVFVFRHDDDGLNLDHGGTAAPECIWPYLIRIRWRMHDPQNHLWDSTDGHAGKWFEQIIPVSRPR